MGVEDGVFCLQSDGGFSCKIAGADAKDYPPVPAREATNEFTISAKSFSKLVEKSSFAVAKDESRACLCGVLWEVEDTAASMVATDGHRLGKTVHSGRFHVPRKLSAILSPKALQNFSKAIEGINAEEEITVGIGEKYVWMSAAGIEICSKLIDGPYPDYTRAIPQNNPKKAACQRRSLIDAVRRVCDLSNQKTNLVRFCFTSGNLELSVLNRDIAGEAREAIPVEYEGPNHTVGFNGYYLSEILGIMSSEKVRMEMNTEISACLLFPHPDQEHPDIEDLFLIMPLRILDES
jgi:DNA polymerase-3 subunit beta